MQPSGTILAYLVEGHPRNISVKLFENWSIGIGVYIIYRVFYFQLWKPSCLWELNDFVYFGREPVKSESNWPKGLGKDSI